MLFIFEGDNFEITFPSILAVKSIDLTCCNRAVPSTLSVLILIKNGDFLYLVSVLYFLDELMGTTIQVLKYWL